MPLSLNEIVDDFAVALKALDGTGPQGGSKNKVYRPGVGPLSEDEAVTGSLKLLRQEGRASCYQHASPKQYPNSRQKCDLVIPGEWAIEFKLIRPYGDNGKEAEHWSENILHPYQGNTSSIGDCLKLINSGFSERKAILVIGYEHAPPRIEIEVAVRAFELIAKNVVQMRLSLRATSEFGPLIHPVHQRGRVFGWEVLDP